MRSLPIAVKIRRGDGLEVGFFELVLCLERPVEDGAGEHVAQFETHQSLTTARGRGGNVPVQAGVGDVLEFDEHFALDFNCVDQYGHGFLG